MKGGRLDNAAMDAARHLPLTKKNKQAPGYAWPPSFEAYSARDLSVMIPAWKLG